jgi:hypothetical protein
MRNLTANLGSKVKLSRTRYEGADERVFLGSLEVSVLAIGPNVRGFKPGQGRWIFKVDKNPQHAFLRRGSKAVGLMSKNVKELFRNMKINIS